MQTNHDRDTGFQPVSSGALPAPPPGAILAQAGPQPVGWKPPATHRLEAAVTPLRLRFRRYSVFAALAILTAGALLWHRREAPVPGELPRAALVLTNGRLCLKDGGAPFTGIVFEQAAGGQRLTELQVREGIVQGLAKGWFDSGAREVEENFENGVSSGVRRRWHENGQLKNEATIVNGELHGPYTEWHNDGTLAVRMHNVHGKGEGLCEAWHPGGAPKAKVTLAAGKPVTKEYFPSPGAPPVPAALTTTHISIEPGEVPGE